MITENWGQLLVAQELSLAFLMCKLKRAHPEEFKGSGVQLLPSAIESLLAPGSNDSESEGIRGEEMLHPKVLDLAEAVWLSPMTYAAGKIRDWITEHSNFNISNVEKSSGDQCDYFKLFSDPHWALASAALVLSGVRDYGTFTLGDLWDRVQDEYHSKELQSFKSRMGDAIVTSLSGTGPGLSTDLDVLLQVLYSRKYTNMPSRDGGCRILWLDFKVCGGEESDAKRALYRDCCHLLRNISQDYNGLHQHLGAILRPLTSRNNRISNQRVFDRIFTEAGYMKAEPDTGSQEALVLACKFSHIDYMTSDECPHMSISPSLSGIVHTFNAANFWNIFRNHSANDAFGRHLYLTQFNSKSFNNQTYPLMSVAKRDHSFDALIRVDEGSSLLVHNPWEVPTFGMSTLKLRPNRKYVIKVTPLLQRADKGILNLPVEVKGCLDFDERSLDMFSFYSQGNCEFECVIATAYRECGCIPVGYPHIQEGVPVCTLDVVGRTKLKCFRQRLERPGNIACDCPASCNSLTYSYQVTESDVDLESICTSRWSENNTFVSREVYACAQITKLCFSRKRTIFLKIANLVLVLGKPMPNSVPHRWYRTNDTYNVCHTSFENATLVQVYIEEKYVNEVKKSRRVTAADLVANIGEHKNVSFEMHIFSFIYFLP